MTENDKQPVQTNQINRAGVFYTDEDLSTQDLKEEVMLDKEVSDWLTDRKELLGKLEAKEHQLKAALRQVQMSIARVRSFGADASSTELGSAEHKIVTGPEVDKDGKLVDGKHRLKSVTDSLQNLLPMVVNSVAEKKPKKVKKSKSSQPKKVYNGSFNKTAQMVASHPGLTASELAKISKVSENLIRVRLSYLRSQGYVVAKKGKHGILVFHPKKNP